MFYSSFNAFVPPSVVRFIQSSLLTVSLAASNAITPVSANPLTGSDAMFERAPRLIDVSTTQPASFIPGGTYEFTLSLPQNAGNSLQAVTISQGKNAGTIVFASDKSRVVANGKDVPLSAIGGEYSEDVTIAFDRPIQPGSTVTISLRVERNARQEGTYSFGVTAYPVGDSTNGLFLGYGHVTLFDQNG
jgi:hypothetical protein